MMLSSQISIVHDGGCQERALTDMPGAFCDLYNAALQQRIEACRRRGIGTALQQSGRRIEGCALVLMNALPAPASPPNSRFCVAWKRRSRLVDGRLKRGAKPGFPRFRSQEQI